MSQGVRNRAFKARIGHAKTTRTELQARRSPGESRPAILEDADVIACLQAADEQTSPLRERFTELQLALALAVLASRRLRQACERGECTPEYRDEVCAHFIERAHAADPHDGEPRATEDTA